MLLSYTLQVAIVCDALGVASAHPNGFLAEVPNSSLRWCGASQMITGWLELGANWVALCCIVVQIIGEKVIVRLL